MSVPTYVIDEHLDYIKINAKDGHVRIKKNEVDITLYNPVRLEMDFGQVETGKLAYVPGQGAVFLDPSAARPPDGVEFKYGFRIYVYGDEPRQELGGSNLGLRELTSTARSICRAMKELHEEVDPQTKDHLGEVPVIEITTFREVQTPKGRVKVPVWKIVDWVPRRKEFVELAKEETEEAPPFDDAPSSVNL